MDEWNKAALSAAAVAALLWGLPLLGRRRAGLLTGLPTVTGPALLVLGLQSGPAALGDAAVGSVAACAPCALFALVQARAGRSVGVAAALGLATLATLLLLPLLWPLEDRLGAALFGAGAAFALCRRAMPRPSTAAAPRRPAWSALLTVAAAGGVTAAVAWSAPQLGAFWAGVLASPPLLAAVVATQQQRCAGCGAAQAFLSGYLDGLPGRAAFAASLALLAEMLALPLAFGIALVVGLLPMLALRLAATSALRRGTAAPAPSRAARSGR
ncbi:hypothetical protein HLB44_23890 [Aquincola sp. S2]|uniref:DUF2752 domain-containing protein n=1 Tax=Pseudaquabacterium terrae TaxID=2732868 RepID=A0ABX2EN43_9BURK|nr:hypothetical protein [Aquabacterium terrae]NRF70051.1 hypothetical protein [Aquabacterium terrae]